MSEDEVRPTDEGAVVNFLVPPSPDNPSLEMRQEALKAFTLFQGEVINPKKNRKAQVRDKTNRERILYEFEYADLAACYDAARPVMTKYGLSFTHPVTTTRNGVQWLQTVVTHWNGTVVIEGGWWRVGEVTAAAKDFAGWVTFWKRYSFCTALGIASDEDSDQLQAIEEAEHQRAVREAERVERAQRARAVEGRREEERRRREASAARDAERVRERRPAPPPPPPDEAEAEEVAVELTEEQRADEVRFLSDLENDETVEDVNSTWRRWKPRFVETMSDALVQRMHQHVGARAANLPR